MINQERPPILLVEDNPQDAEITTASLLAINPENPVFRVQSGEESLEFIFGLGRHIERNRSILPKMIILDLGLPHMSGFEVLQVLRSYDKTRKIPVIILSASEDEKVITQCYQFGANSYIVKPLSMDGIYKNISEQGCFWMLAN